ncbi:MAG: hypothetical protein NTX79_04770 [Candidatus Micrarchaeota archaeon]|nr:hypothetical protein [Candidatus Micrarchaeota archaeon]
MISVSLDRASYAAGDTITATISVSQQKPLSARGLSAALSCTERRQVKTEVQLDKYDFDRDEKLGIPYSSNMATKTEELDSVISSQEKALSGAREFFGEEKFTAQFALPPDAAPTSREFGHDSTIHIWKLRAKLDIPMAMDENAETEVFVEGL